MLRHLYGTKKGGVNPVIYTIFYHTCENSYSLNPLLKCLRLKYLSPTFLASFNSLSLWCVVLLRFVGGGIGGCARVRGGWSLGSGSGVLLRVAAVGVFWESAGAFYTSYHPSLFYFIFAFNLMIFSLRNRMLPMYTILTV